MGTFGESATLAFDWVSSVTMASSKFVNKILVRSNGGVCPVKGNVFSSNFACLLV